MNIDKNSDKEQLEKLTEKHQQIQSGIKNLQNIEEGLFKNGGAKVNFELLKS